MVPSWSIGPKYIISALKSRLQAFWSCRRSGPKTYRVCLSATVVLDFDSSNASEVISLAHVVILARSILSTCIMGCHGSCTDRCSLTFRCQQLRQYPSTQFFPSDQLLSLTVYHTSFYPFALSSSQPQRLVELNGLPSPCLQVRSILYHLVLHQHSL